MTEFDCNDCFVKKVFDNRDTLKDGFEKFVGGEPFEHFKQAHREMLLAVRSLIDVIVEEKPKPKATKARKVRID